MHSTCVGAYAPAHAQMRTVAFGWIRSYTHECPRLKCEHVRARTRARTHKHTCIDVHVSTPKHHVRTTLDSATVGEVDGAVRMLDEMSSSGVQPDAVTHSTVITILGKAGRVSKVPAAVSCLAAHACVILLVCEARGHGVGHGRRRLCSAASSSPSRAYAMPCLVPLVEQLFTHSHTRMHARMCSRAHTCMCSHPHACACARARTQMQTHVGTHAHGFLHIRRSGGAGLIDDAVRLFGQVKPRSHTRTYVCERDP